MNDIAHRPISRLPRPVVVAAAAGGKSRTRSHASTIDHNVRTKTSSRRHLMHDNHESSSASRSSLPLIDLGGTSNGTSKQSNNNNNNNNGRRRGSVNQVDNGDIFRRHQSIGSSRIPVHVAERVIHRERIRLDDRRPQTSCASEFGVYSTTRRKTSSGKRHLLKKLQTLSLRSADSSCGNQAAPATPDYSTKSDRNSSSSSRFARLQPLPAIGHDHLIEKSKRTFLMDYPIETFFENGKMAGDQFDNSIGDAHKGDTDDQRPVTSGYSNRKRPDSGVTLDQSSMNLVRSRTYDIIPTSGQANSWTIKEEDEEYEDLVSSRNDDSAVDLTSNASVGRHCRRELNDVEGVGLLLAIRLSSTDEEDLCYGYFKEGEKVKTILDFYHEVSGDDSDHIEHNCCHKLSYKMDDGEKRILNLDSTIVGENLSNRKILNVIVGPEDNRESEEIIGLSEEIDRDEANDGQIAGSIDLVENMT